MTTLIEAAQQALEALKTCQIDGDGWSGPNYMFDDMKVGNAITALRQAIEQAEKQEPVAHIPTDALEQLKTPTLILRNVPIYGYSAEGTVAVFTTPPPRQPLTDEQKDAARWRFLVDNSYDKEGLAQFHVWHHTWEPHSQTSEPTEWKARVRGPALERVIDEAIEAAHGIKGEA